MARPASSTSDILLYFLAIFVSPASVFLKRGCAADFWINLCLFILGWLPGVIHAWWIISRYETPARPHQQAYQQPTYQQQAYAAPQQPPPGYK